MPSTAAAQSGTIAFEQHAFDDSSYWENKGRSRGTGSSLYTARPDGSDLTQLTPHKNEVSFASDWSPDGSRIVFTHYQFGDDHFQIRTIAADGSDPQTVVDCDPDLSARTRAGAPTTARCPRPPSPGPGRRPSGPRRRGLGPTGPAD